MSQIAFIGSGSCSFTQFLVQDILSFESLQDSRFTFMDVDKKKLDETRILVTAFLKSKGLDQRPLYTTNLKRALEGSDFVINLVKIGFSEGAIADMEIPKKYGILQTIGDTCGVGGIFRGLRTIPFCIQLCKEVEALSNPELHQSPIHAGDGGGGNIKGTLHRTVSQCAKHNPGGRQLFGHPL